MKAAVGCLMLPFLLPIIGVIVLIIVLYRRGKKQAYTGLIVEKIYRVKEVDDDGFHKTSHLYSIKVKIDGVERIHAIALSKELYDQFQEGDRIEKKSGESWPHKITK
jgi:hypothetical protein